MTIKIIIFCPQKLIEDLELEVIEARFMASKVPGADKKTDIKSDSKVYQ